ncbi:TetR/AcrR family transcriptional regulator [Amycolatopsis cynarae]|uniref:TetR/AcrR family transcriptional regulator n=1 Tax=Amycolatopsis cynarae TaxID=2995223 RepID=A0ABY7BAH5_9PSEU|nr:TetR/AcrR family transcriptional regulator [Amycolatopsis sp. HUAS 11-8]WAL69364.1 TetR/AcrR family transcriptional regulator [Amycolatopsis sp. HUAS 11-8]
MTYVDPRVARSQQAFRAALLSLAAGEQERVSVTKVCTRAGLNRTTFYLHYTDVDDLLADTLEDLAGRAVVHWRADLAGQPGERFAELARQSLLSYLEHVESHRALYRWALGEQGSSTAVLRVLGGCADAVVAALAASPGAERAGTDGLRLSAFLAGAMVGVLAHWVAEAEPEPPGVLMEWLWAELTAHSRERVVRAR